MDIHAEVMRAEARIRPYVRETPLAHSPALSHADVTAYLKLENIQHTGSFKVRGALNKLLSLTPEQRAQGIVTASSGNHGAGVAYGLKLLGMRGLIYVPDHAAPAKVAMIRQLGAEVRHYGDDSVITEAYARQYARERDMVYVSPYNDPQVIGGQGTIAVELARQLERIDAVFVAVGGGGLIAGIAGYLKARNPGVLVVGCLPVNSPVMAESIKAGQIVDRESLPTLSDATAGGIEPQAITFALCRQLVDDYILVTEDEIAAAIRRCIETEHLLIEGAAGVAVAAYQQRAAALRDKHVAIILCGANISSATLKSVL